MLYDMHCHLDFAEDGVQAACRAAGDIAAFSATVDPHACTAARHAFGRCDGVRVGLGLHPWQASRPGFSALVDAFVAHAPQHAFIGEVGLDFSAKHEGSRMRQLEAFERVVRSCLVAPGDGRLHAQTAACGIVSIHAVHAISDVLDVLEREGAVDARSRVEGAAAAGRALVVHSFNGTSDELHRAVKAGLFFSVGPRMLASKRGRAYARAIPLERLLLETDMPPAAGAPFSLRAWHAALEDALAHLAAARGQDQGLLRRRIEQTSRRILGLDEV